MAEKLYLMSGHTSTERLKDLDERALTDAEDAGNSNVLVLNLSCTQKDESEERRKFFEEYFYSSGVRCVETIEEDTPEDRLKFHFDFAGLIYLPGGDTRTLIQNIRKRKLVPFLEEFPGVISGNSAGTYAMCPDYLRIGRGEPEIIPALGFVDFWTKVHYKPKFDTALTQLSKGRVIYALEDESAIVVDSDLSFVGNIWRFSEGVKEKIN